MARACGARITVQTTKVEFHGWRFLVDLETTRAAYATSKRRGARDCTCLYCKNLVAARAREYPEELRDFLGAVGVDPHLEAEVWEAGPLDKGLSMNAGWWHFAGDVESEGEPSIRLRPNSSGFSRDWSLTVLPGQRSLALDTFGSAPLVQVEFVALVPWVLDAPYP